LSLLPILVILASFVFIWIRVVSPGNVLFRQTRIGRGGKPFTIYKFRSMNLSVPTRVHEAHVVNLIRSNKPMTKLDVCGDSRLIRGGGLLRISGLDELPQFFNILRGEMSLVGPRPCLPREFELYHENHLLHRFDVQPGLTGQWQVERNESTTFSDMVRMDDDYVDHLSPVRDMQILLRTPIALLGQVTASGHPKAPGSSHRRLAVRTGSRSSRPALGLSMGINHKLPN
jgi:lipopolysaccharide/colanic/teichoic acid biosynthesis glycosyltransferase